MGPISAKCCLGFLNTKTVIGLMEKICELDKLHSGRGYNAVGSEFNINELTIYVK